MIGDDESGTNLTVHRAMNKGGIAAEDLDTAGRAAATALRIATHVRQSKVKEEHAGRLARDHRPP